MRRACFREPASYSIEPICTASSDKSLGEKLESVRSAFAFFQPLGDRPDTASIASRADFSHGSMRTAGEWDNTSSATSGSPLCMKNRDVARKTYRSSGRKINARRSKDQACFVWPMITYKRAVSVRRRASRGFRSSSLLRLDISTLICASSVGREPFEVFLCSNSRLRKPCRISSRCKRCRRKSLARFTSGSSIRFAIDAMLINSSASASASDRLASHLSNPSLYSASKKRSA